MRFGTGGGVGDRPADHNLAGGELCEPTARKRMLAAAAPLAGREASALTLELSGAVYPRPLQRLVRPAFSVAVPFEPLSGLCGS